MHPETLDYFDIKISVFLCISSSLYVFSTFISIYQFYLLCIYLDLSISSPILFYLSIYPSFDLLIYLFINSFHSSIVYKPLLSIYQSSYRSISLFLHFLILSYIISSIAAIFHLSLHQTRVTTYVLSKTADCHQYLNQVLTVWLGLF